MVNNDCVLKVTVAFCTETYRSGFGPGMATLLSGIRKSKSINKAAKEMSMAYSKAWKGLNAAEEALGFKLIERNGPHGSVLTPEGEAFLDKYWAIHEAANAAAQAELTK